MILRVEAQSNVKVAFSSNRTQAEGPNSSIALKLKKGLRLLNATRIAMDSMSIGSFDDC